MMGYRWRLAYLARARADRIPRGYNYDERARPSLSSLSISLCTVIYMRGCCLSRADARDSLEKGSFRRLFEGRQIGEIVGFRIEIRSHQWFVSAETI